MERKRVSTSKLLSVGYEASSRTLEVELNTGAVYRYSGVSPDLYRRFMGANSLASFFEDHIEEAFPAKRVLEDEGTKPKGDARSELDKLFGG